MSKLVLESLLDIEKQKLRKLCSEEEYRRRIDPLLDGIGAALPNGAAAIDEIKQFCRRNRQYFDWVDKVMKQAQRELERAEAEKVAAERLVSPARQLDSLGDLTENEPAPKRRGRPPKVSAEPLAAE